jgi:hypothetical protein
MRADLGLDVVCAGIASVGPTDVRSCSAFFSGEIFDTLFDRIGTTRIKRNTREAKTEPHATPANTTTQSRFEIRTVGLCVGAKVDVEISVGVGFCIGIAVRNNVGTAVAIEAGTGIGTVVGYELGAGGEVGNGVGGEDGNGVGAGDGAMVETAKLATEILAIAVLPVSTAAATMADVSEPSFVAFDNDELTASARSAPDERSPSASDAEMLSEKVMDADADK